MNEAQHLKVIDEVLENLNSIEGRPFILKGGTALLKCYGLDRFSEDIDIDAAHDQPIVDLFEILQTFCDEHGYFLRRAKDTDTVKRGFIRYVREDQEDIKPLKVELSLRNASIPEETTQLINGIRVYTLDRLCQMKSAAFMSRDRLRDLYDITFIVTEYYDQLAPASKATVHDALEYKGLDQLDYLLRTQDDGLINTETLELKFLQSFEKVGLISPE